MTRYCSYCGRPLEEGEICHCMDGKIVKNDPDNMDETVNAAERDADVHGTPEVTDAAESAKKDSGPAASEDKNGGMSGAAANGGKSEGVKNNSGPSAGQQSKSGSDSQRKSLFERKLKSAWEQLKKVLRKIFPILKNPVQEINTLIRERDHKAFYMILIHMITIAVSAFIMEEGVINHFFHSFLYRWFDYSRMEFVFCVFLVTGAADFLLAALFLFTTKIIFNADTDYHTMLSIVSGASLISSVTALAGSLISLLLGGLGSLIVLAGAVYAVLATVFAYSENVSQKTDKKIFALLISFMVLIILLANIMYLVL